MKISIRLYRDHDIDLVTLYKNPDFGFQKALKRALKAHVNNRPFVIFPPVSVDVTHKDFKYVYQLFLNFDEEDDADIIEWLSNVKYRKRNEAIKSLLRGCVLGSFSYSCMANDEDRIITDKINKTIHDCIIENMPNDIEIFNEAPKRREVRFKRNNNNKAVKRLVKTDKTISQQKNKEAVSNIKRSDLTEKSTVKSADKFIKQTDNEKEIKTKQGDINDSDRNNRNNEINNNSNKNNEDGKINNNDDFDLFASAGSLINQFM